jgi:hypothetical protein
MRGLAREPLVHFLVGGALLFALYRVAAGPDGMAQPDRIVVSEQRVAALVETFRRTWLRPPTPDELDGLIRDHIDEEILYREALALGLDRDDLVVRRRLRQKMEFLHADLTALPPPGEAELAAFLVDHADRFRLPARRAFRQVYVNPAEEGGPGDAERRARALLERLRAGESEETAGDPTLLPGTMRDASRAQVAGRFGDDFAEAVFALEQDGWQGPVASSFGLHLVRVDARTPARLPALADVRSAVARDLEAERREAANRRVLEALRERYPVEVRMPDLETAPVLSQR